MSDTYLPEVNAYSEIEEKTCKGFRSALFLNMSISEFYPNCETPNKGEVGRAESRRMSNLSMESINTPGTTPKANRDSTRGSGVNCWLSKDLLQRLEESSPFNVHSNRNDRGVVSDVCFDNEECMDFSSGGNNQISTTGHSNTNYTSNKYDSKFDDEVARTLNFDDDVEEEKEKKNTTGCNSKGQGNNNNPYMTGNINNNGNLGLGTFMNVNMNINMNMHLYNPLFTHPFYNKSFIQPVNASNQKNFNKFNPVPFPQANFNQNIFNFTNPNNTPTIIDQNVSMYGKNGWVCGHCKNFNYEIRVKCNRCGKTKNESPERPTITTIPSEMQQTDNSATSSSQQKKKKPFVERAGDWNCFKCKNLNFSFRVVCNRCHLSKKESEQLTDQQSRSNGKAMNGLNSFNDNYDPDEPEMEACS